MKNKLALLLIILSSTFMIAQEKKEDKKKFYFNTGTQLYNFGSVKTNTNFYFGLEYKLNETNSIAVNFNYFENDNFNFNNQYLYKTESAGIKFQYNHDWSKLLGINNDKFDIYTGVNFGIGNNKYTNIAESTEYSRKDELISSIGTQIGVRYFITKKIGINLELNSNKINTGLTYKF